ncbi:MAG: hypothetical protein V2A74_01830 [bacterium]
MRKNRQESLRIRELALWVLWAVFVALVSFQGPRHGFAQDAAPAPEVTPIPTPTPVEDLSDDPNLPRAERIRRQQLRIQQRLEKAKQLRDEEEKARREETQQQAKEMEERQKQTTAAPKQGEVSSGFTFSSPESSELPSTVLFFDPLDVSVEAGHRFQTDVVLQASTQQALDRVDLWMSFEPDAVEIVKVFDNKLRPLLREPPTFSYDREKGELHYLANLKDPQKFVALNLLKIVWEARSPDKFTMIALQTERNNSAVSYRGNNLLVTTFNPKGGTIPAGVTVSASEPSSKYMPIIRGRFKNTQIGNVRVLLHSNKSSVAVGEEFDVDVKLGNPERVVFDQVSLFIRFDPKQLEVLDRDRGNWIRRGTNLWDGLFHAAYPFDLHMKNEANNSRGEIQYKMGLLDNKILPSGTIGRIRFLAKEPAMLSDIRLVFRDDTTADLPCTDVTYLGNSLLPYLDKESRLLASTAVSISEN